MKSANQKFPLIRIHPAAYAWLQSLSEKLNDEGTPTSMATLASQAILSIPDIGDEPNGNGHKPTAAPVPCEEKK